MKISPPTSSKEKPHVKESFLLVLLSEKNNHRSKLKAGQLHGFGNNTRRAGHILWLLYVKVR